MRKDYKALANSPGTVGIETVLCVLIGYGGGHWLDVRFGTEPYLSIFGFGLGVAAAVKGIMRVARDMKRVARAEEAVEGNPAPMFDAVDKDADKNADKKAKRDERKEGVSRKENHDGEG